ncbi:MAG: TlpA disulfide reductase family protein [Myxococcota bacterium]
MWNRRDLVLTAAGALAAAALPLPAAAATASNFSLRNLAGKEVNLTDYEGRVVLLSFWATWCGPCKVEMKHLHEYHTELAEKGLTVLFISIDDARAAMAVKQYVKKQGYDEAQFLLDPQSEAVALFNAKKTVPLSVLIDKKREIVKTWEGFNPGEEVAVKEAILAELAKNT